MIGLQKLAGFLLIAGLVLLPTQAMSIQANDLANDNQANDKACRLVSSDAQFQVQDLAEITCTAELTALNCDQFFETDEDRKSFKRQCPSSNEPELSGFDLGMICASRAIAPTVDSVKAAISFLAAGVKQTNENRARFIAQCEKEPVFKTAVARSVPLLSSWTQAQIDKTPCSYLVVEFEDAEKRDKELNSGERARAAYEKYISSSHEAAPSNVTVNPFLTFIKHNKDKWKCLNQAGRYEMLCYGFFSVVDPTVLVGGAVVAVKGVRLGRIFNKGIDSSRLERLPKAVKAENTLVGAGADIERAAKPSLKNESVQNRIKINTGLGDQLDNSINSIAITSLEDGLKNSGIDTKALQQLSRSSAGMYSLKDFLKSNIPAGTPVLGMGKREIYGAIAKAKNLEIWNKTYQRLGIQTNEFRHTEKLMDKITSGDQPVVMLVPNQVLSARLDSVTRMEMLWLLKHPERLKNVRFVFGAYDPVSYDIENTFYQLHLTSKAREKVLSDILNGISQAP